jgi:hypothetical protein
MSHAPSAARPDTRQAPHPAHSVRPGGPTGSRGAWPGWWAGLRDALHAEWTKLRTVSDTAWMLAAAVRDSAMAIGVSLGLLYVPPILIALTVSNPVWLHRLEWYTPTNAGLTIQDTTGLHSLAITPWGGLGVLAVWAAGGLLLGGLLLRLRDA